MMKETKTRPLHTSCKQSHVACSSTVEHIAVDDGTVVQLRSGNPRRYIEPREAALQVCAGCSKVERQTVNLWARKGHGEFNSLPAH